MSRESHFFQFLQFLFIIILKLLVSFQAMAKLPMALIPPLPSNIHHIFAKIPTGSYHQKSAYSMNLCVDLQSPQVKWQCYQQFVLLGELSLI